MIRMVKTLLCIVIIFCGAVSGLYLSRRLTDRRDVLSGFEKMLHHALIWIEYNAGDLCEVFSDNFASFDFSRDAPFDRQWRDLVNSVSSVLKKDDITLLTEFLNGLGTADSEAQRRHIQLYIRLLQERIDSAKEDIRSKSKAFRIVPLSAGALIALMLI